MRDFYISTQEKLLESKHPKLWGWRYLFRALLEIQRNQHHSIKLAVKQNNLLEKQVKLLRDSQPHKITDEDVSFIKEMMAQEEPQTK